MYIESVPNRNSPPAILLRESYREQGKVKKRTLANLSHWPAHLVESLRILLKGGTAVADIATAFTIERSLPYGAIAAVLGSLNKLGLHKLIDRRTSQNLQLVLAMIVTRILEPGSKPATARLMTDPSFTNTLAQIECLNQVDEDDLHSAMNWLLERQPDIEKALAQRHLKEGALVMYDLTSVCEEGSKLGLAKQGKPRDGSRDSQPIESGLLCDAGGCPVAVEIYSGNTADPKTVGSQISKLQERFGLSKVVLVGDRGMLTEAHMRELETAGIDWISSLRRSAIRELVGSKAVQLLLLDEKYPVEIHDDAYPDERLIVCRNPSLAEEQARKREELLKATEAVLEPIKGATRRKKNRLRGEDRIGAKVGKWIGKYRMAEHFEWCVDEDGYFHYTRKDESIAAEAQVDGLYVIHTSLPEAEMGTAETVCNYNRLSAVKCAFCNLKSVDKKAGPILLNNTDRVRAHLLLCMLAYHVEWHMRQRLAPLLFDDEYPKAIVRPSKVAPAEVSESAKKKARAKRDADGNPTHSFRTLMKDLATIARNTVLPQQTDAKPFEMTTRPTALQRKAFRLLGVKL